MKPHLSIGFDGENYTAIYQDFTTPKRYICTNQVQKRVYDHGRALQREKDRGVKAVLSMVGRKMNEKSDGFEVFCLGGCMSGKASGVGKYAGFQNYQVKKLRELKYCVSEYLTSQKFPGVGYQTSFAGMNKMRIKYCAELDIYNHRDIMAAENMADILAYELIFGVSFLCGVFFFSEFL
jgi:hypothetical protein